MRSIHAVLEESLEVKRAVLDDAALVREIEVASQRLVSCFRATGRALFCGNGGSAADAQHFAAELSGRFLLDRDPLPAEALHANSSFLTAVGNDYGYDEVFARAVRASGRSGDVLVALSTSGLSTNVVLAARAAREIGLTVIGMTGADSGLVGETADICIAVPSKVTARVQEAHIAIIHAISEQVEATLFGASQAT